MSYWVTFSPEYLQLYLMSVIHAVDRGLEEEVRLIVIGEVVDICGC